MAMLKIPAILVLIGPLLAVGHASPGCGNVVVSTFRPGHFKFKTILKPPPSPREGGWQVACVDATLIDIDTGATMICEFEVGAPLRTGVGDMSLKQVQAIAAQKANDAAHEVISTANYENTPGILCEAFKAVYAKKLSELQLGFRLRHKCYDPKVPIIPYRPRE